MTAPSLLFLHEPPKLWEHPVTVTRTGFENKALCSFVVNTAVGCSHGCTFCYVPSTSTVKQAVKLKSYGVSMPAIGWGSYVLPRIWDERTFRRSVAKATQMLDFELVPDGNRAVMFSSTTDPIQTIRDKDPNRRRKKQEQLEFVFQRSLEILRDESDFRVRILTRSTLAVKFFDLFASLGDRLLFGMSIPSTDDRLVKLYEPNAPAASKRIEVLKRASERGLHVYVAVAPTFPRQGIDQFREFLTVIKDVNPYTVFHEPINVRGDNIELTRNRFIKCGEEFEEEVLRDPALWAVYAVKALREMEQAAVEVGLSDALKLWPDSDLLCDHAISTVVEAGLFESALDYTRWVHEHWSKPVRWPDMRSGGVLGDDSSPSNVGALQGTTR